MDNYIMKNKGWFDPRTNKPIDKISIFYPRSQRGSVTISINQYIDENDAYNSDFILNYENDFAVTSLFVKDKDGNVEIRSDGSKYYKNSPVTSGYVTFKNKLTGKIRKFKLVELDN